MAIIPEDITTLRVDQLPNDPITATSLLPHQVGTDLKQDTVQGLIDLVATAIGASSGVGYLAISVTDGQQLPDVPENPSFFLCGAGTYLNVGGFPDVVCTEQLNAVMSLADHWELAVGIPIITTLPTPNFQQVTEAGNITTLPIQSNDTILAVSLDGTTSILLNSSGNIQILSNGHGTTISAINSANTAVTIPSKEGFMALMNVTDNYINDAAAFAGGIEIGQYYHTAGVVKIRLT